MSMKSKFLSESRASNKARKDSFTTTSPKKAGKPSQDKALSGARQSNLDSKCSFCKGM